MSKSSALDWCACSGWQPCNCLRMLETIRFQESRMPGNPLVRFDEGRVGRTAWCRLLSYSTGAVRAGGPSAMSLGVVINLLTIVAMFVRNLALLTIFSLRAGLIAFWPILVMALSATGFAWWQNRTPGASPMLKIGSPFEIRSIANFGLIFVVIQIAGSLGQRFLGTYGTIGVSIL